MVNRAFWDPAELAEKLRQWEDEWSAPSVEDPDRLGYLAERAIQWVQDELAAEEKAREEERESQSYLRGDEEIPF